MFYNDSVRQDVRKEHIRFDQVGFSVASCMKGVGLSPEQTEGGYNGGAHGETPVKPCNTFIVRYGL